MSDAPPRVDSPPPGSSNRIPEICDRFEAAARAGPWPRIEDYLDAVPEPQRAALLAELLARERAWRLGRGDAPEPQEYRQRFPRHPAVVAAVFPPSASEPESVETSPHAAPPSPAEMPERLGRYRVTAKLGEGGFGVVYKGRDEDLRRDVAIKVPHRQRVASAADAEAYLAEARVLAGLDHPGIVPVYDFGRTDDGLCYVVSKLVGGSDLAHRLRQGRPSRAEAVEIVACAAEALHHAHQRGLVHRDVKPANILLDARQQPVVADFGLALREQDVGTGPNFAGTPAYMSPEQARGEGHRVDARSDVYSLGVVLYEMLTGQRPFQGQSVAALSQQIATLEPRPPRQVDDTVPRELDRICLKALSKRAADRYSTALDLAEDLRHWRQQEAKTGEPESEAQDRRPVPAAPSTPTPTPLLDSAPGATKVVPKGLRSFDAGDADFFLELLPGPRGRDGLPESVRFWKCRVEETDADQTFSVGLIYGPSGSGKSSLVKAGLLPRLSGRVTAVYVEAVPDQTEARLLRGLRKRCPELPPDRGLVEALAWLRRHGREGKKVLLVLDQFEQWLHTRPPGADAELVQAFRQCDGERVQAVVLVRDDFWMAASRFMRDLEVTLVEGGNSMAVDLFDPPHARKVLAAFGRAFGALPEGSATPEQDRFLDAAVAALAPAGKVVSVQLSLFAEMVKSKPWKPATLKAVGGLEGLGVTFLDETFCAPTAPPEHRRYQRAAQGVLQALLPEHGSNIKGHLRSRQELLAAAGLERRPREFEALLRILDHELRLVTPTEHEAVGDGEAPPERGEAVAPAVPSAAYYQLTHDYLVPALRQWLTRKQRETRRGRAGLRLAERSAIWNARPEKRHLPSWWEWTSIRLCTRRQDWSPAQRSMMRAATRHHAFRMGLQLAMLVLVGWGGYQVLDYSITYTLLHSGNLASAEGSLKRPWGKFILKRMSQDPTLSPDRRAEAWAFLLKLDSGETEYVATQALRDAEAWSAIYYQLARHVDTVAPLFWAKFEDPSADSGERGRALRFLLAHDAANPRWSRARADVARLLTREKNPGARVPHAVLELITDNLVDMVVDPEGGEETRASAMALLFEATQARVSQLNLEACVATSFQGQPFPAATCLACFAARQDRPDVIADVLNKHGEGARAVMARWLIREKPALQTVTMTDSLTGTSKVYSYTRNQVPTAIVELVADQLLEILHRPGESRAARVEAMARLVEIARDKPDLLRAILQAGVSLGDVENRPDISRVMVKALSYLPELGARVSAEKLIPQLEQELRQTVPASAAEVDKEALAKRQSLAAVVLICLGQEARVTPLLRQGADPRLRAHLVHRFHLYQQLAGTYDVTRETGPGKPPGRATWELLLDAIAREQDVAARRTLILCLGRNAYVYDQAHGGALAQAVKTDPDAGVHAALQCVGIGSAELVSPGLGGRVVQPPENRSWFVGRLGQFSIMNGPVEFDMGAPAHEAGRTYWETPHRRRIARTFAISAREVSESQFQTFLRSQPAVLKEYLRTRKPSYSLTTSPAMTVSWYMAAQYCRWLSQQERVPEDQMCYPPIDQIKAGMKLPPDYLSRTGYRLPTEAEWEYACRAGASTSRYYGSSDELLPEYARCGRKANDSYISPSTLLLPNDFGLFDMLGGAAEWCQDRLLLYPRPGPGQASEDREDPAPVVDTDERVLRGGSMTSPLQEVRCAFRAGARPSSRLPTAGFRVARTMSAR